MKQIIIKLGNPIPAISNLTLCLGYFDGLHLGHQKIIKTGKESAKSSPLGVMTFSSSPRNVLTNIKEEALIDKETRNQILTSWGVDYLFILEFDRQLSQLSPEQFINEILLKTGATTLIFGSDYRFGHQGKGTAELLKNNPNFNSIVIKRIDLEGNELSSSAIRRALFEKNFALAERLLGHKYLLKGNLTKVGNYYLLELSWNYYLPPCGEYKVVFEDKKLIADACISDRNNFKIYLKDEIDEGEKILYFYY